MMFNVSFQINGVWCANIALGTEEQVRRHYEKKYGEIILSPAAEWEVEAARERGKPIVDCR